MLFLTDASVSIPDALLLSLLGMGIVFLVLVVLMLVIKILTAIMSRTAKKPAEAPAVAAPAPAPAAVSAPAAPGTAGEFDLNGVDERTAAMAMAIVADEMKTPIAELRFKSIKEVREDKKK